MNAKKVCIGQRKLKCLKLHQIIIVATYTCKKKCLKFPVVGTVHAMNRKSKLSHMHCIFRNSQTHDFLQLQGTLLLILKQSYNNNETTSYSFIHAHYINSYKNHLYIASYIRYYNKYS